MGKARRCEGRLKTKKEKKKGEKRKEKKMLKSTLIEIRDEFQKTTPGLRNLRGRWVRKCNRVLDRIKEIAKSEGKGSKLGMANMQYNDFLKSIKVFLTRGQIEKLSERHQQIQEIWRK